MPSARPTKSSERPSSSGRSAAAPSAAAPTLPTAYAAAMQAMPVVKATLAEMPIVSAAVLGARSAPGSPFWVLAGAAVAAPSAALRPTPSTHATPSTSTAVSMIVQRSLSSMASPSPFFFRAVSRVPRAVRFSS